MLGAGLPQPTDLGFEIPVDPGERDPPAPEFRVPLEPVSVGDRRVEMAREDVIAEALEQEEQPESDAPAAEVNARGQAPPPLVRSLPRILGRIRSGTCSSRSPPKRRIGPRTRSIACCEIQPQRSRVGTGYSSITKA